jgi:TusE/DsrC/DsvC family sulfur relay protein
MVIFLVLFILSEYIDKVYISAMSFRTGTVAMHSSAAPQQIPATVADAAFDEDGFLVDGERWHSGLATALAAEEGLDALGEQHWRILDFIRDYHARFGAVPMLRRVCRREGIDRQRMKRLFGSCRSAWRIAGLPNPGEEAKAYMN